MARIVKPCFRNVTVQFTAHSIFENFLYWVLSAEHVADITNSQIATISLIGNHTKSQKDFDQIETLTPDCVCEQRHD